MNNFTSMGSIDNVIHTIYFVRHGESMGNVSQKFLNSNEDVLTETGKLQADLLGKHFSEIRFDQVYCSSYHRAIQTAQLIIKNTQNPFVKIREDERLKEIARRNETFIFYINIIADFGFIYGKSYKEGFAYIRAINRPVSQWEFPEGETFRQSGERMENFFKELCLNLGNPGILNPQTILVVSHSVAAANFLSVLSNNEGYKLCNWNPECDLKIMKNASYMKMEVEAQIISENGDNNKINLNFKEKHVIDHLKSASIEEEDGVNKFVKTNDYNVSEFSTCVQQ